MSGDVAEDTEEVARNMNMLLSRIKRNRFLSFNNIFPPKFAQDVVTGMDNADIGIIAHCQRKFNKINEQ